jgi:oxygen-independent coproporphyrinogen-3 oxidase
MQTTDRFGETLQQLLSLTPDRIALFGYAHVPWMARRQKMIDQTALPNPKARLRLFQMAQHIFNADGYQSIGIDHFALQNDPMALASQTRMLFRNFQGYTTDPSKVLIGVGASAISKFPQGYAQNAPGTAQYSKLIDSGDLATVRGHALTDHDRLNSDLIAALLCQFQVRVSDICDNHDIYPTALIDRFEQVNARFENLLNVTEERLIIPPEARPLTRMIAREFDAYSLSGTGHSYAT